LGFEVHGTRLVLKPLLGFYSLKFFFGWSFPQGFPTPWLFFPIPLRLEGVTSHLTRQRNP